MPPRDPNEPFTRITVDEAKAMIDDGGVTVVDVRNPDEWATGHVPKALLISVDNVIEREDELPRDKDLLFICAAGVRSALAAEYAAAIGLDRLFNIEGGTTEWVKKGYPTDRP